jgi:dolichol-phosphate mannosyltransferase
MLISIVTPTYNEYNNIDKFIRRVRSVIAENDEFQFEIIIIDNFSIDGTVEKLKNYALNDKNIKLILNSRNYGHLISPYYGILNAHGDAVVFLVSDLQDPPELIQEFINRWKKGYKIVLGVKKTSETNSFINLLRRLYYRVLNKISRVEIINDATGFGLYDKKIVDLIRDINDPNPYFRGLICELGYKIDKVEYFQKKRNQGLSKNNIYTLYSMAMLAFTNYSYVPIRLSFFFGVIFLMLGGILCVTTAIDALNNIKNEINYLLLLTSIYLFTSGLILLFIGILGEYVALVISHTKKRPLVIESERVNF